MIIASSPWSYINCTNVWFAYNTMQHIYGGFNLQQSDFCLIQL